MKETDIKICLKKAKKDSKNIKKIIAKLIKANSFNLIKNA